jgi:hypothetical protein
MKIAGKLAVPAIIIAGGLVFIATEYDLPYLIPLAMAIFGIFALILGIETIITGRIEMLNRFYSRREFFSGLTAHLYGVMILLFGLGITLYTFFDWIRPGTPGKYLEGLVGSPLGWGIMLVTVGLFTIMFGLIRLIAGSAHRPGERSGTIDLGYRVRGLINILIGVILLGGGIWFLIK